MISFLVFTHLAEEEIADCLTLTVYMYLLWYGCLCSVSLPRGAVGWSVVYDCGIFSTCSLFLLFANGRDTHKAIDEEKICVNL